MERFDVRGISKRTANESPQMSIDPENRINKSIWYTDMYRDRMYLSSEMQMMSDSLAACRRMSKCRSIKKVSDISVSSKAEVPPKLEPETSSQILLRSKIRTSKIQQNDGIKNATVFHIINENGKLENLRKCERFDSWEEIMTGNRPETKLDSCVGENCCRTLRNLSSSKDFKKAQKRSSTIRIYNQGEVDPTRMMEVIQRELQTLMDMTPSMVLLITALSDAIFHCKECFRCGNKISSSLPLILNRIQKLIKYVTTKRHGTYFWPDDYSYLRLIHIKPLFKETKEENAFLFSELKSYLLLKESEKPKKHLRKVDADVITENRPGFQILLRVKPEVKKKRLLDQAEQILLNNFHESFPIVHLKESVSTPIIQILKSSPKPKVIWDKRNIQLSPKELFYAFHKKLVQSSPTLISYWVLIPMVKVHRIEKAKRMLYFKPIESYERRIFKSKKNLLTVFLPQGRKRSELRTTQKHRTEKQHPNEKKSSTTRNCPLPNAPKIVHDLLKETKEDEVQFRKMRELEFEVNELKNLMFEIHKNQVELIRVVLEKEIYSQPIIKLTDPDMLEEENRIVRKLIEVEELGSKNSVETLQTAIHNLKQKCTLKNKMIVTLLKCFRSNEPKEWWEEIINSFFDESKPIEEFDPERVEDFIRQTSLFLLDDEKESRESLAASGSEEQRSEEEPNTKEVVGAVIPGNLFYHDKKLAKMKGCMPLSSSKEFLDYPSRTKILAHPVADVQKNMSFPVGKLENQVSLLNMENKRLRHEVHELRNLLKSSMKDHSEKKLSYTVSDQKLTEKTKIAEKIINLIIQLAQENDFRCLNNGGYPKTIKDSETYPNSNFDGMSNSSPVVRSAIAESVINEKESVSEKSAQDQNLSDLTTEFKFRSKSERRRSECDLNYSSSFSDCHQENEKLRRLLREKNFIKEENRSVQLLTPRPSRHEIRQNLKPVVCMPSECISPESFSDYQAELSRRPAHFRYLPRSPSQVELTENLNPHEFVLMANERELQTIPEHDYVDFNCFSNFSKDVSQAIQRLRIRIRSIHKDVTVLKSKNERIDKILDRLIDDVINSSMNLDETAKDLNNFKNRLGQL